MNEKEWLASLKSGDMVAYESNSFIGPKYAISQVDHITPSGQIVVRGGRRFWPDGLEITSNLRRAHLEPMSDKIRDEIHKYTVISDLRGRDWSTVSLEKLQRILAIIEEDEI